MWWALESKTAVLYCWPAHGTCSTACSASIAWLLWQHVSLAPHSIRAYCADALLAPRQVEIMHECMCSMVQVVGNGSARAMHCFDAANSGFLPVVYMKCIVLVLQYMVSYQTIVAVAASISFFLDGSSLSSLQVTCKSCFRTVKRHRCCVPIILYHLYHISPHKTAHVSSLPGRLHITCSWAIMRL